jgi:hypothetical protein
MPPRLHVLTTFGMAMLIALVVALVACGFLHAFYRVVQVQWPNSYFGQTSELELKVSRGRLRYATFRFGPVFVAALFAAVTTMRTDNSGLLSVAALWFLHTSDTSGRALLHFIRRRAAGEAASVAQAALAVATAAALAVVCLLAWVSRTLLQAAVPQPSILVESLWTATFAGIVAAFALKSTEKSADIGQVIRAELTKLRSKGLTETLAREAKANDVSAEFLTSLMIAESLERPRWFRQLERLFSFTRRRATYGVMQVSSSDPLSDDQSIAATAAAYRGYRPEHTSSGPVEPYLRAAVARHNPDANFIDLVSEIYAELVPVGQGGTASLAPDRRPVIEVARVAQVIDGWEISGTASVHEGTLIALFDHEGVPTRVAVTAEVGAPGRGAWQLTVPLRVRDVAILEPSEADHVPTSEERRIAVNTHYVY